MENTDIIEAKERIINASIHLFSQKGFDAASVNEIAEQAGVTKALIYYYFKSKEEILDSLVSSLMANITSIAMDFIHTNIIKMIKEGRLDIEPDRLHFVNVESRKLFLDNMNVYYKDILEYVIEHRAVIRILMLESLKNSKHHDDLFKIMSPTRSSRDSVIFKTISDADRDFNFSDDMVLFEFFFATVPLFNFAAYYDDYKEAGGLSDEKMQCSFLQSSAIIINSLVSGSDILLGNSGDWK